MPDLCDVILDEHATFRRRFAELDEHYGEGPEMLGPLWQLLSGLLERHAAAEEAILYPQLLRRGSDPEDETDDAVRDHTKEIKSKSTPIMALPAVLTYFWSD
ncbi:MAG: hemerythrin domain-containing protein [Nocardioidaceae bacterium]